MSDDNRSFVSYLSVVVVMLNAVQILDERGETNVCTVAIKVTMLC